MRHIFLVFVICVDSIAGLCQSGVLDDDLSFDHIWDGLSQNTATAILQDKYGFVWVGTWSGLNRFDGVEFKIYQRTIGDPTTLADNYIFDIYEDSYGELWIGTRKGLSRYKWSTDDFETIRHDPDDPESLSGSSITTIFGDSSGELWIGTEKNGLNRYDRKTGKATRYIHDPKNKSSLPNNSVTTIFEDRAGRLWVGTRIGGLSHYDPVTDDFVLYPSKKNDQNTISSDDILTSFRTNDGNIWIGTSFGANLLYMTSNGEVLFKRFLHEDGNENSLIHNTVRSIAEDDFGNIWLGTENGGLSIYNPLSDRFRHILYDPFRTNGIAGNSIWSIYKDQDGRVWLGALNGGLIKLEKSPSKFVKVRSNPASPRTLSHNNVSTFLEDSRGGIWVGTDGGGLNYYDKNTKTFKQYWHDPANNRSLGSNAVITLYEDSQGRVWVGTWEGGLNMYDPSIDGFRRYKNNPTDTSSISSNSIFAILEDRKGRLWVGAYWSALELFSPEKGSFQHFYLNEPGSDSHLENAIEEIIEDRNGNLWISTWGEGLVKFHWDGANKPVIKHFKHSDRDGYSISSDVVLSSLEDSNGVLWFGTTGAGLNRYDPGTERFHTYTRKDGLPSDDIQSLVEDDYNNLWMGTNNGLSKFNPTTGVFKNYNASDGLQSNQFLRRSAMKSRDGTLYFGGINGFNVFKPQNVKENKKLPLVHVTDFYIHSERVISGRERSPLNNPIIESNRIELKHDESVFQFNFVAINYTEATKNEYAYILEGYDSDWKFVGNQRSASYTRVPPGDYVFKVKASNNDGIWNEAGSEIFVSISPPWWRTWWAYGAYSVFVLAILFWARMDIVKRERLKANLKLEHIELIKMQELDQLKSRFFANISHEFRTPLSLILGPLRSIYNGTYKGDPKKQFAIIIRNGQRLLQLINQLLDLSKLEAGRMNLRVMRTDIVEFLRPILASFTSHAQRQHQQYKTHIENDHIIGYIDKDKLEKIVLNLLSNAFKFTPEYGTIFIKIKENKPDGKFPKGSLQLILSDTGIGISEENLSQIFNRFYQVDGSHSDKRKGTGIGLSLTKELVELHGGEISVESIESEGTTFTVNIPLSGDHLHNAEIIDDEFDKESIEGTLESIDEVLKGDYSPERSLEERSRLENLQSILIIDDNADIRSYLGNQLEANYSILESDNGTDGFAIAVSELPDLIISDVMMPGTDGLELCQKIKLDERTCHIPVILLTAKADSENKIEGFEAGADYYVTKPFNSNILELRIKNILRSRELVRDHYGGNKSIELEPSYVKLTSPDETFLKRALESVETNMSNSEFSVEDFGRDLGMSRMQLYRKLKALTGQSANEFIRTIRLKRAAQLIEQDHLTIAEITYEVGFNDLQYFRDCFKKQFGVNPSKYQVKPV